MWSSSSSSCENLFCMALHFPGQWKKVSGVDDAADIPKDGSVEDAPGSWEHGGVDFNLFPSVIFSCIALSCLLKSFLFSAL